MSNTLTENLSFEEKLKQNIKNNIGDLVSPEDLEKIVKAGLHSAFFGKYDAYNPNAPIYNIIREILEPQVKELSIKWLAENEEVMQKILKDIIDKGAANLVFNAFSEFIQPSFDNFTSNVGYALSNLKK